MYADRCICLFAFILFQRVPVYVLFDIVVCMWDGACYSDAQLAASLRSQSVPEPVPAPEGAASHESASSADAAVPPPALTPEGVHEAAAEALLPLGSDAFEKSESTIADKAAIVASHVVMSRDTAAAAASMPTPTQEPASEAAKGANQDELDGAGPDVGL
jgi:hypothetical protein